MASSVTEQDGVDVDVAIVGMGAAGLSAAIEAHDHGATVVVLEKAPEEHAGGQTRVSGGTWFDNRDPDAAATYLRALCGDRPVPEAIVEVWAVETARNSAWVASLGAELGVMPFTAAYPELPGHDCFGGLVHVAPTWGMGRLFDTLLAAARRRGIELRFDTRATGLVAAPGSGAILGVDTEHRGQAVRFRARRGVVLATGGFQADPELLREHVGLVDAQQWGSPYNTGDGHRLAMKVGAGLWHMQNHFPMVGLRMDGYAAGMATFPPADGFIYVGPDGSRFVDEQVPTRHGHAFHHGRFEQFPSEPMWVVFDERTRAAGPFCRPFEEGPYGWSQLVDGYRWSPDNCAEIERGWISTADSLEQLAKTMGIDPAGLVATVARYNEACGRGVDEQFGREPATLVPIDRPPYYGFRWGPVLNFTCGGPRRNERAQVLDAFGQVIPRLYCAGEMSMSYSRCFDSGMPIADALAFGRIAGRQSAAEDPISDVS